MPTVAIKHPVPDWVKPSFVIFDIRALWRPWLSVQWLVQLCMSECSPPQWHGPALYQHGFSLTLSKISTLAPLLWVLVQIYQQKVHSFKSVKQLYVLLLEPFACSTVVLILFFFALSYLGINWSFRGPSSLIFLQVMLHTDQRLLVQLSQWQLVPTSQQHKPNSNVIAQ